MNFLLDENFPKTAKSYLIALRQPNRAAIMQKLEWLFTQQKLFPLNNKVLQLRDETCRIRQSGNQINYQ